MRSVVLPAIVALAACGRAPRPFSGACLCGIDSIPASSPAALEFGAVAGGQSKKLYLAITNAGDMDMAVGRVDVGGDFTLEGTLPPEIPPGASARLGILFSPSAVGTETATLTVETDSQAVPLRAIPLSGTGLGAATDGGG